MENTLMNPLHRIIYISLASTPFSDDAREALLEKARDHNRSRSITGVLLCAGDKFMQCLEGPARAVTDLYRRIESDPRHHGVVQMHVGGGQERIFSDWSMACRTTSEEDFEALYRELRAPGARGDELPRAMLRVFWDYSRREMND
jgi:hypothetical protein